MPIQRAVSRSTIGEAESYFVVTVRAPSEPCRDVPDQICQLKPIRSSVFFWLCENCCSTMTLNFDPHTGLAIVPISSTKQQGNMIGVTEPQELSA